MKKRNKKIPYDGQIDDSYSFLYEEDYGSTIETEEIINFLDDDIKEKTDYEYQEQELESVNESDIGLAEKSSKIYWTEDTENAIVEFLYLNEFFYENRIKEELDDAEKNKREINKNFYNQMQKEIDRVLLINDRQKKRDKIFRERIETPLKKLVENILFNYKLFLPDTDAKTQQKDCFTFLYLKFTNFNPWRGTKSYSFFGTIAKHYFLCNKKDFSKSSKILNDYDSSKEEADNKKIEQPKPYIKEDVSLNLFNFIINSVENELNKNSLSKNDQKVGDAIVQIFKNHELLGVYNKNHVYQLIKENTNLETKDITYSLHRFRMFYKNIKQDFIKNSEQ